MRIAEEKEKVRTQTPSMATTAEELTLRIVSPISPLSVDWSRPSVDLKKFGKLTSLNTGGLPPPMPLWLIWLGIQRVYSYSKICRKKWKSSRSSLSPDLEASSHNPVDDSFGLLHAQTCPSIKYPKNGFSRTNVNSTATTLHQLSTTILSHGGPNPRSCSLLVVENPTLLNSASVWLEEPI